MCLPYGPFPYLPVFPQYCVESSESQKIKLNNKLISNCDIIICTSVPYFLLPLIGWSKAGSTNENSAPQGGTKCNWRIQVKSLNHEVYRRSPHFVIFGTKRVSRNSGITNFETLFSAKSQIGPKNFLKSTFLAIFSVFKSQNTIYY